MPALKQLPAPVSHLKARMRSLKRPMVWGPAAILGLILLFTLGYWFRPAWFGARNNRTNNDESGFNPSLSSEDSAIGADIDSLPLLLKQFESSIELPDGSPSGTASKKAQPLGILSQPSTTPGESALEAGATADKLTDPNRQNSSSLLANPNTSTSANPLAQRSTTPSLSRVQVPNSPTTGALSTLGTGGTEPGLLPEPTLFGSSPSITNAPLPVSPLQRALDQSQTGVSAPPSAASSATTPATAPSTGTVLPGTPTQTAPQTGFTFSGVEGSGMNYSNSPLPNTSQPPNAFNYLTSPSGGAGAGTSDFSSTPTVPSLPSAPGVAPAPSSSGGVNFSQPGFSSSPSSTGLNNSGFSSTINNPTNSTIPNNTRPFSTPRRTPGRSIGGGEINTFSNP